MIIDSHAHFGSILDFKMPGEKLIGAMDNAGINCAVVSNIEGMEFDHRADPLSKSILRDQIAVNEAALDFSRKHPGRIYPLIWVMPHTGGAGSEFRKFISSNRRSVYGLKFHPFSNQSPIDSDYCEPYIKLAAEFDLPVVVHTASSDESSPARVGIMAQKYPGLRFLLVHMGLYTDNEESIGLVLRHPNIYGDTTWVRPEKTMELIMLGGIDKIMFGTDAPIGETELYSSPDVQTYIREWEDVLGSKNHNKLLHQNAEEFFGIVKKN